MKNGEYTQYIKYYKHTSNHFGIWTTNNKIDQYLLVLVKQDMTNVNKDRHTTNL